MPQVFRPQNPWTMAIMNVLAELHQEHDLKVNNFPHPRNGAALVFLQVSLILCHNLHPRYMVRMRAKAVYFVTTFNYNGKWQSD